MTAVVSPSRQAPVSSTRVRLKGIRRAPAAAKVVRNSVTTSSSAHAVTWRRCAVSHQRRLQQPRCHPVVRVEHDHSLGGQVAQQVELGGSIGRHARMPIQMVGRHIQDGAHRRTHGGQVAPSHRRVEEFQLETAQLQDDAISRPDRIQTVDQRRADVAADMDGQPTGRQHLADQCGRGRLAAAARERNDRPEAPCLGQLEGQQAVVAQWNSACHRLLHDLELRRYPTAQAKQITAVQQCRRMLTQHEGHGQTRKFCLLAGQLCGRRRIADGHLGARSDKEARQGHALSGETQDDDSFARRIPARS